MSYNGSGQFNLPAGHPFVSGTTISSSVMNTTMNEIATGLSTAVLKDGQQTVTSDIPFNSNKITGLGAATSDGDAMRFDQRNIVSTPDATDAGTDAYEAALGYALSTGDTFVADVDSANTTTSPTLENTSGAPSGAQSIVTTEGAAFVRMLEARPHRFQWDGTNFVVLDPAGGVVEKGSNSNGEYRRYADGTQVCRKKDFSMAFSSATQMASTWTFPAAFSAAPVVVGTVSGRSTTNAGFDDMNSVRNANATATTATVAVERVAGSSDDFVSGDTVSADVIAQGEWS